MRQKSIKSKTVHIPKNKDNLGKSSEMDSGRKIQDIKGELDTKEVLDFRADKINDANLFSGSKDIDLDSKGGVEQGLERNKALVEIKDCQIQFNDVVQLVVQTKLPISEQKAILFEFSRSVLKVAKSLGPQPLINMPSEKPFPINDLNADPYLWLRKYYSPWLKLFSPELDRDYLFQNQLAKIDPGLMNTLRNRRKSIRSIRGLELNEIISTKDLQTESFVEHLTLEEQSELQKPLSAKRRALKIP